MAQHPFAAQARAVMEQNGIVFNSDGSTGLREGNNVQPIQHEPQRPNNTAPTTPPVDNTQPQEDEKDRLIAMQRAEIERLKNANNQFNPSAQVQKSDRETELEQQLADLKAQMAHQTEEQQADAFREVLDQQGFDSENLDDDVLLEIRDRFFRPVADKFSALEERLAKAESKFRDPTPDELREQAKTKSANALRAEIPDFDTIFNSQAFQDRLAQKDNRFPFKATYGHALQEAYESGNTEFIVNEVKAFMNGTTPDLSAIADVGATNGVGTGQVARNDGPGFTYSNEEAEQMLRKVQRGDISRREYSEYRAKLEANRSRS